MLLSPFSQALHWLICIWQALTQSGMGKKSKNAQWRKIDITDITEAATDRQETLLKGGKIEDKPSEELFAIEKKKKAGT